MSTTKTLDIVVSCPTNESAWNAHDRNWVLGLFATAIGAGTLFLPINAGLGGIWPLLIMAVLAFPMTYLAHRGLMRFVLSSSRPGSDITEVVTEHFGVTAGKLITLLYFFTILPILLIYGVGLTNTVATNTVTASVAAERAGMASGADTSARMISLAFNIAVMGFVLVEGVTAYLRNALGITEGAELRQLAEKIAAGDTAGIVQNTHLLAHMAPAPETVHAALAAATPKHHPRAYKSRGHCQRDPPPPEHSGVHHEPVA